MELAPKFEEATELLAKYFEKDVKIPIAKIMLEAGKRGIPLESMELASSSWALFPISIAGEAYWIDVYDAEIAKSVIKELVSKIEEENSLVSILKIVAAYYSREA